MGNLIAWLVLKGVSPKFARPLAYAALALTLLAVMLGMKMAYDRNLIRTHDSKREATIAKADRKADATAAEQRRVDDERANTENQEIKEAVNEAVSEGRDGRAAYYACIERLQAARRGHLAPPDC